MSLREHPEYAGKLALLGAFQDKGIDISRLSERFGAHVEQTAELAPPSALEIGQAAGDAFRAAANDRITIEQYQKSIKPKEPSLVSHPATKRRCLTSVHQAPS